MTNQQLCLFGLAYSTLMLVVVFFTRPTRRRMLGSFAGGAAATLVGAGAVLTGEAAGWWHFNLYKTPNELAWVLIISAISMAPLYLITWRVMRRFGIRGLITMNVLLGIVGP